MQQLSSADSSFLYIESPSTPNVIAPVLICDQSTVPGGKVRLSDIKAKIQVALEGAPIFRRKLVRTPLDMDDPYWVDDADFDLDFHIRHMALPQPGDRRQFEILVARLLSRPLDTSRPLWEMNVIEGLDNVRHLPKGSFAVMIKVHHAMVDGMGMLALLNGMLDTEPLPAPPMPTRDNWQPQPGPTMVQMLGRSWLHSVTRPGRLVTRAAKLLPKAMAKREKRPEPPEKAKGLTPKVPYNGPLTAARVYASNWYTLAEFKAMRGLVTGSTVNDVVLAIAGGAQRRYLEAKGVLPATSVVAMVPISLRKGNEAGSGGNELAMIQVQLQTQVADPVDRLRKITAETAYIKQDNRALNARAMAELSAPLPGRTFGTLARAMARVGDLTGRAIGPNTLVTNVPGMTIPMYFCGARVVNMEGGGPCAGNIGMVHLVGSYCEWFTVGIVGVRDLVPDIDFYMQCIDDTVDEYRAALAATGIEPPPAVPAPGRGERRTVRDESPGGERRAARTSRARQPAKAATAAS
jgi:diacylglycerol O-acyltransferase